MSSLQQNQTPPKFQLPNDSEDLEFDDELKRTPSSIMSGSSQKEKRKEASKQSSRSKEAKWVRYSKQTVFGFLLIATTTCAAVTYTITSNAQQANFETQFEDFAMEIVEVSSINSASIFSTIRNMGLTISSYAADTNQQWPFVTVPHFEQRGQQLLKLSGARYLALNVLVDESEKLEWQNYSVANQEWVQKGLDVQGDSRKASRITPYIYKRDGFVLPDDGPADPYYGVTWQISPAPVIPTSVNFNRMSTEFRQIVDRMEDTKREVLSQVLENRDDTNFFRPESYLVQPVFREVVLDKPEKGHLLVGYLNTLLPWDNYFRNIIPAGTAPVHLVLHNTCGQTMTYRVEGPNVILLSSKEDVHDPSFDALEVSSHFNEQPEMLAHTPPTRRARLDGARNLQEAPAPMMNNNNNNTAAAAADGDDEGVLHHTAERHKKMEIDPDNFYCWYEYSIYPSQEFHESLTSKQPLVSTIGVVLIFLLTSMVFILYDVLVTKRQHRIEALAARTNAIVTSLFPAQVRERLMQEEGEEEEEEDDEKEATTKRTSRKVARKDFTISTFRISHFSKAEDVVPGSSNNNNNNRNRNNNNDEDEDVTSKLLRTKPIADLFPNATVLFADISGFTAWSSVREPTQVFTLLEQIYNSFDIIARRRRIFKVETIGDCYVAAAGLPDPRPDHAVAMARFSSECMSKMYAVVKKLEVRLGPGTSELNMRFGLHSGPVTAGVLRGEKSRFQLFGDTVNTASRIETTGERGRVHLSESTAQLLMDAGKRAWVERREGMVSAKGKGDMITYWLTTSKTKSLHGISRDMSTKSLVSDAPSFHSSTMTTEESVSLTLTSKPNSRAASIFVDEKKQRLIDWNADVLLIFLKKITASRANAKSDIRMIQNVNESLIYSSQAGMTVLEEVKEIIALPQQEMIYQTDPESIVIDPSIVSQVQDYVTMIAVMYRPNSFHNFEHASHVTQSVSKLLSRIVKAEDIDYHDLQYKKNTNNAQLHHYTFGITSDPITQFACAFSALIHDADHTGVPNVQLVKEETDVAKRYKNKSVAEQNAVDSAWSLLMEKQFEGFRSLIYTTQEELERFRQLVVNSVMATDIADKELAQLRRARWDKAFHDGMSDEEASAVRRLLESAPSSAGTIISTAEDALKNNKTMLVLAADNTNRKATIVIEHLIQASDVSHTMQHWHVFTKWNEKLFHEMYKAYKEGRAEKNPADDWYQGELGFFDFYVIPLAKKLKECGVFGVASDEYLTYAEANRNEWEQKGKATVDKYMAVYYDSESLVTA